MSRNPRGTRGRSSSLPGALPGEFLNTSHEITDATFNSSLTSLPSYMASVRLVSPPTMDIRSVSGERSEPLDGEDAAPRPSVAQHPAVAEEEVPPPYAAGNSLASASTLNNNSVVTLPSPQSETSVNRVREASVPGSISGGGIRVYPSSEPSRTLSGLVRHTNAMQSTPLTGGRADGVALTADQLSAVQSAIMGLTPTQRELVRRRMDAVESSAPHQDDTSDSESTVSRGEGPSNFNKGKGPDPLNWGGVADMDPEELDVEAQRQAFLTFNQLRDAVNRPDSPLPEKPARNLPPPFVPSGAHAPSPVHVRFQPQGSAEDPDVTILRDEITQLKEQVALLSLLQRATERVPEPQPQPPAPPAFSALSASAAAQHAPSQGYSISGPSQYGAETVSRTMMPSAQIDPSSLLGKLLAQPSSIPIFSAAGGGGGPSASVSTALSSGPSRVPILKPREPEKYKGTANVQVFQKFAQEATAYCVGYAIPPAEQVFRISSFLDGKAWAYYQYCESGGPDPEELTKFLSGLFNYCFPLDYKQRMREKLEDAQQEDRSVQEFVHELNGLYIMLGSVPEPLKVVAGPSGKGKEKENPVGEEQPVGRKEDDGSRMRED
ncbi:hypothetical protein LXA43DRAFT_1087402 [Ganoderma leucocontextum]|nr:hypothetical protein LXA43DRAFT_1087402 [Ganoderma leucocontextum]